MKNYDVEELYSKEYLTLPEVAFLMGGVPIQNVYAKLKNGRMKCVLRENQYEQSVKRIASSEVKEYIKLRKRELKVRFEALKLPSEGDVLLQ